MSHRLSVISMLLILLITVPGIMAQETTFPPGVAIAVQAEMDALTAAESPPGIVVWIDTPGGQWTSASGYSFLSSETPLTPDEAFKIGSITKLFTATVVLQLMEEDALTLDDSLAHWVPDVASQLPYGDQITVRQLLNHTAGVYDFRAHPDLFGNVLAGVNMDLATFSASAPCPVLSMTDFLATYVYDQPATFVPGAANQWSYSNSGYILLGMIIEAVTGEPLATVYRARILDPLEMTGTYLECNEDPVGTLAGGHTELFGNLFEISGVPEGAYGWSAGGLVATAPDVATFARALFTGQLFFDSATLELMVEPLPHKNYGLGVTVNEDYWAHEGAVTGYTGWVEYRPAQDAVVVVLFNSVISTRDLRLTIADSLPDALAVSE